MRVAQILTGDRIWGVERYLLNLVDALPPSVETLAVCLKKGQLLDELNSRACRAEYLQVAGYSDLGAVLRLCRLLKERRTQVLHTHLGLDSWIGTAAAALLGIPVVSSVHFDDPAYTKRPVYQRIPWQTALQVKNKFVDFFLPITAATALSLEKRESVRSDRIKIVHPGIPAFELPSTEQRQLCRRQFGIADGELLLSSVGRLNPEKGMDLLIRAFATVSASVQAGLNLKLLIAGEGTQRAALEKLIGELGLQDRVKLLGYCPEVRLLLFAADLFVLFSRNEPFGIAAVEAMMAGLPVIASSGSGLAEIVLDKITGVISEAENTAMLSEKLLELLTDRERRNNFGKAGRQRALENYSSNSMAKAVMAIYEQVCRT